MKLWKIIIYFSVCGETAALRAVIAANAQVSTPDVHGGYPLHYAAQMCGGVSYLNIISYYLFQFIPIRSYT